jgi:hypothetical protein
MEKMRDNVYIKDLGKKALKDQRRKKQAHRVERVGNKSQDNLVHIAKGYGLDGPGSIPSRGKLFFSTPQHSYRLWGPGLSSVCTGFFIRQQSGWGFHIHLALRSRMMKLYLHSPIRHHSMVLLLIKHKENSTFHLEVYIAIWNLQDIQPHRVSVFTEY